MLFQIILQHYTLKKWNINHHCWSTIQVEISCCWLVEIPYWWNWGCFVTILRIFPCGVKNIIFTWRGALIMRTSMQGANAVCKVQMAMWGENVPHEAGTGHRRWKCPTQGENVLHKARMSTWGENGKCEVKMPCTRWKWPHKVKMPYVWWKWPWKVKMPHARWKCPMCGENGHMRWKWPHKVKMHHAR